MNSYTTKRVNHATWQNVVIFLILLCLLVSALPNLYNDKISVVLVASSGQHEPLTPHHINKLLASQNLNVDETKTSLEATTITLKNNTDQHAVENLLRQNLGDNYYIETSVINTSPAWLKALKGKPIKLGLDLSGGVLFVLDVDTERALSDKLSNIVLEIRSLALKDRVRISKLTQVNRHSIELNFPTAQSNNKNTLLANIKASYPELIFLTLI